MKFNIEDVAYFYHQTDNEYAWQLYKYQKVIIENKAFDKKGEMFYSVKTSNGNILSWYCEKDLLSEQEIRKHKIKCVYEKIT